MAYVPVTFAVVDQEDLPVEGVVLRIFSLDLQTAYFEGVSSAEGLAEGLLPEGVAFELRYFYPKARSGVLRFTLEEGGGPATVRVPLSVRRPEDAADPLYCNIYEHFRGDPFQGAEVELRVLDRALSVGGSFLLPAICRKRVSPNGSFSQVFPRGARVQLSLPGADTLLQAVVPDQGSVRLADLFFPYLARLDWGENLLSVSVGEEVDASLTVHFSDGSTPSLDASGLEWVASPGLNFQVLNGAIRLSAAAAGTYTLTAREPERSVYPEGVRIGRTPAPVVGGNPLVVEVA